MARMQLSRDPTEAMGLGEITYEVSGPFNGKYRVDRVCDNGSNASLYRTEAADAEFANELAERMAESEDGTVI